MSHLIVALLCALLAGVATPLKWRFYVFHVVALLNGWIFWILYAPLRVGNLLIFWYIMKRLEQGKLTRAINWYYRTIYWLSLIQKRIYGAYNDFWIESLGVQAMAIQVESNDKPKEYVPESERGEDVENPATFFFEKLPYGERAKNMDDILELDGGEVAKYHQQTVAYELTIEGLSGWKNVYDGDQEVEFDGDNPKDSFDQLPDDIQIELVEEFGLDKIAGQADQQTGDDEDDE